MSLPAKCLAFRRCFKQLRSKGGRKLKKKGYWLVFLVLTLCLLTSPAMAQKHYLNMGSTSSTSGVYAWCVATANVINKSQNDIQVTVIESGAALDNLRKIKAGVFDFALCVDLPSAFQMVRGMDTFQKEKWEDVRWLFTRNITADRLYVRKDSGVTTFKELKGKKFCPGIPGSASADYIFKFNDLLKADIKLMPAAIGDAVDAMKNGAIIGLSKTSPLDSLDAAMIEVNLTLPITVIGYSEDDVAKIRERYPYMIFLETPKGKIKQLPEVGPIMEECAIVGAVASARLPEELGYKIVKAYVENLEEVASAYPAIKGWDPVADFFKNVPPGGEIYAHAGLIRYAQERGIEVPERFIPPEYKK